MYVGLNKFREAPVLKHAHARDAGFDVFAGSEITIPAYSTEVFGVGFGIELPDNAMALLMPRTSIAKLGLQVAMCPIDPGYTGEIYAIVHNAGSDSVTLPSDIAIAQLVFVPIALPKFMYGDKPWDNTKERAFLPTKTSERGDSWMGSTNPNAAHCTEPCDATVETCKDCPCMLPPGTDDCVNCQGTNSLM